MTTLTFSQKYFRIYNIFHHRTWKLIMPYHLEVMNRSYSRNSNIELPMREHSRSGIYPHMIHRLSLWLVDSHSKTESNWKFKMFKFEWNLHLIRNDSHLRNEDKLFSMFSCEKLNLQNLWCGTCQNSMGSIANPISWIDVLQHHNRTPNLQCKFGKR